MIKMDRTIADVSFILDCLILLRDILDQGSCNDCCNKNCTCKPNPGDHVRYNCPYFEGEEGK